MTEYTKLGVEEAFFNKLREGSRIKQKIVTGYFVAYNNVMARGRREKVGYADLFAGPGVYTDANGDTHKSIPVLVCEATVFKELFRKRIHLWFNEGDHRHYERLKGAIAAIEGIETLRYAPTVDNKIITARWVGVLARLPVPTLIFLDPCGYKGLSLKLVASVLGGFGNDCIFFFNYSRINMKLDLEIMNRSIDEFFERDTANALRTEIQNRKPPEREGIILTAVKSAIRQAGAIPLVFRFRSDNGRISHHLVYASKESRAANMMKSILRTASSTISEGVGSGEHNPRDRNASGLLFGGMYEVEERLLSVFARRFGSTTC